LKKDKGVLCAEHLLVADEEECQKAAKVLGLKWKQTHSWSNRPHGCIYIAGSYNVVEFNTHNGTENLQYYSICRQDNFRVIAYEKNEVGWRIATVEEARKHNEKIKVLCSNLGKYQWISLENGQIGGPGHNCEIKSEFIQTTSKLVIQGDVYYTLSSDKKTWSEAEQACKNLGGQLSDHTPFNKDIIMKYSSTRVWLDGTDHYEEGNWTWDSSGKSIEETYWDGKQPDNSGNEDCLASVSGVWNDARCNLERNYVCYCTLDDTITVSNSSVGCVKNMPQRALVLKQNTKSTPTCDARSNEEDLKRICACTKSR
jgi:hypothetical protein